MRFEYEMRNFRIIDTHIERGELDAPKPRYEVRRCDNCACEAVWDSINESWGDHFRSIAEAEAACARLNAPKVEPEPRPERRVKDEGRFYTSRGTVYDSKNGEVIALPSAIDKEPDEAVARIIAAALSKAFDRRNGVVEERKGERRKKFLSGLRAYDGLGRDSSNRYGRRFANYDRRQRTGTAADREGGVE